MNFATSYRIQNENTIYLNVIVKLNSESRKISLITRHFDTHQTAVFEMLSTVVLGQGNAQALVFFHLKIDVIIDLSIQESITVKQNCSLFFNQGLPSTASGETISTATLWNVLLLT